MDVQGTRYHEASVEDDIDDLNDETFGDGAIVDDWEASHLAEVGGEGNSLPTGALHHDDAIVNAIPITSSVETNHTISDITTQQTEIDKLDSSVASLSLKELWPSSPKQTSNLESIWSSPEIPRAQDHAHLTTPTMGGVPPGQRVISVEELERDLTSSPPTLSSLPPPPNSHTPPSLHSRSPPPTHMMYHIPPPMHGGRLPLPIHHPFMTRGGWPIRGPLPPPPPHLLPPHMLHHHQNHPRQQQPPGIYHAHPLPPHPLLPHPTPQYPNLLPHPSLLSHPVPRGPSPRQPRHDLSPQREKSKRSELLNEMKGDGSGFMTQREKEWVVKVQLLQLQGNDPQSDDYYYLNYVQRKARRESDDSASLSLALPQVTREEHKYRGPVKFEQTLGKVSSSSLTAPRKVLDIPSSGNYGDSGGGQRDQFTGARKRQILLIIEKLYSYVLTLEDLDRKAFALREEERGDIIDAKTEICSKIFSLLRLKTLEQTGRVEEQIFQQITNYRKGKRLLKRVFPILTDVHAQAVFYVLLKNIITILKRDITEQMLPELIPSVRGVVSTCDFQLTTLYVTTLLSLPTSANQGPVAVVKVASCEFGSCILLSLVQRGNLLCDSPYKTRELVHDWLSVTNTLHSILSPHTHILSSLATNTTLLATLANTHK